MAVRTVADRSRRSSIWEMCGSSSRGFSSRARRVSSSGSWINACRSSLGAECAYRARAESSSGMCLALPQTNRHFCRGFRGLHLQRNDACVRRQVMQARVNRGVEKFAAPVGAAGLGDGNFAVLHSQFFDDAGGEIAERGGGGGEDSALAAPPLVAQFAHQWKNPRAYVVRILHHPVEDATPFLAAEP